MGALVTASGHETTHIVRIETGTRLASIAGGEDPGVNSVHHQAA
jgi:gamma-glutamyl-gamma-aminobutyrate hydrolase PuuD